MLEKIIKTRIGSQDNDFMVCYVGLCALIMKPKMSHSIPDAKGILF